MTTDSTLIGFVVDRSSSMAPYAHDTVAGFNQFLDDQRNGPGECRISLMLFNHTQDVVTVAKDIADVDALTAHRYAPNGNTALLDSFGMMIDGLAAWVNSHGYAGQVKVVVFTDGEENASHQYSRERLNEMVGERQAAGWEFIFLGSGGAAWLEGRSMSYVSASSYNVGVGGQAVYDSFAVASSGLTNTRSTGAAMRGTFDQHYRQGGSAGQPAAVDALSGGRATPQPAAPKAKRPAVKNPVEQLSGD